MSSPAEGGPAPADSPLDEGILEELADFTSPGLLDQSIEVFFASADKGLGLLRAAQARGDTHALERSAHSLRGSCAIIGARRMMLLAAEIEEIARTRSHAGVAPLVARLDHEYARTREALRLAQRRPRETER